MASTILTCRVCGELVSLNGYGVGESGRPAYRCRARGHVLILLEVVDEVMVRWLSRPDVFATPTSTGSPPPPPSSPTTRWRGCGPCSRH